MQHLLQIIQMNREQMSTVYGFYYLYFCDEALIYEASIT